MGEDELDGWQFRPFLGRVAHLFPPLFIHPTITHRRLSKPGSILGACGNITE